MVMSPYCSLAMQNNPRSTIYSLYQKVKEIATGKNIKIIAPRSLEQFTHGTKLTLGAHWDDIKVTESQRAIIMLTLKGIVQSWIRYTNNTSLSDAEVIKKINSGDCGLMAIIAHHVLAQKYNILTEIWMNNNHCWISHAGTDFDTSVPEGYPGPLGASAVWSNCDDNNVLEKTKLTLEEACNEWMPCDAFGGYLVKGICDNYGIRFPQALQHCIDNAEKYDSPEMVASYKQQAAGIALR